MNVVQFTELRFQQVHERLDMISSAGMDRNALAEQAFEILKSGVVLDNFRDMVVAQGGDPDYVDRPQGRYPGQRIPVLAPRTGYVAAIDGLTIGLVGVDLGVGRHVSTDSVDYVPGFSIHAKVGSHVHQGDVLAWIVTGQKELNDATAARVLAAWEIVNDPVERTPIVTHLVSSSQGTQEVELPPVLQKLYDAKKVASSA